MKKKKLLDIGKSSVTLSAAKTGNKIDNDTGNKISNKDIEIKKVSTKDIAVTGVGIKLLDTTDIDRFQDYISVAGDAVSQPPEPRLNDILTLLKHLNQPEKETKFLDLGYMKDIDRFDYRFFKLSPREASLMDPNQRLFLQTAWTAIENAGYGGNKLKGSNTGVFVGHSPAGRNYEDLVSLVAPGEGMTAMPGNMDAMIPSRIGYILDFKGPAVLVNTACSSSLVALHQACRAIRSGECDQAIAGSVKITLLPIDSGEPGEIQSSDGRTHTFDDASDGTGSGEGAIAFLLKPLSRAQMDGDFIYAVIKGSAVNQDGSSIGITAPNANAQADVISRAWEDARIDPKSISYIEAHGTGTKLGDPIEIEGLTKAFRRHTPNRQFCAIGSIKSNIGHLDHAAGLAGFLNALLALKYKQLPPLVHFKRPNRRIPFEESPVYINRTLAPWEPEPQGTPRRCGISSFGLSGTNCHVILEEAPFRKGSPQEISQDSSNAQPHSTPYVLALSARTQDGVRQLMESYRDFLHKTDSGPLADICFTANTGRGHFEYRLTLTASTKDELAALLEELTDHSGSLDNITHPGRGIFYGHHRLVPLNKKVKETNELTETDKEAKTAEAAQLVKKHLEAPTPETLASLLDAYVRGAEVDWERFHKPQRRYRVPVPTYPFEENRCWLEPAPETMRTQRRRGNRFSKDLQEPLIHRRLALTPNHAVYASDFIHQGHWLLREHKVNDIPILVGTAYLEMAMEVARNHFPGPMATLENLVLISPLIIDQEKGSEVQTVVEIKRDSLEFEVVSSAQPETTEDKGKEEMNWLQHGRGIIRPLFQKETEPLDLEIIKKRCSQVLRGVKGSDDGASREQSGMVQTGPRWDNMETIYIGDNEALALLALPESFANDEDHFTLHPPLMDNALNFAAAALDAPYLPMIYKKAHIYGPTPLTFYSYIRKKPSESDEVVHFDVVLAHESGEVFARFEDYTMKKIHVAAHSGLPSAVGEEAQGGQDLFYQVTWTAGPPPPMLAPQPTADGGTLVLTNRNPRAEELLKKLEEMYTDIIVAECLPDSPGTGPLQQLSSDNGPCFSLPYPATESRYGELLKTITPRKLRRVIYLTAPFETKESKPQIPPLKPEIPNGSESPTPPTSPKAVHDGGPGGASPLPAGRPLGEPPEAPNLFTTESHASLPAETPLVDLYRLTRALVRSGVPSLELIVAAPYAAAIDGDGEKTIPINAALSGLARVIPMEYTHITCRCLDFDHATEVETLVRELNRPTAAFHTVYRNNTRYTRQFGKVDQKSLEDEAVEIRPNGVYLITGGLGGIGLQMARHLAHQANVHLVLISRRSLPDRERWDHVLDDAADHVPDSRIAPKIRLIKQIEATGSTVSLYKGDVSDQAQMEKVLQAVREKLGPVNGILHCAGNAGDGFLVNRGEAAFLDVLKPKISGSLVLDRLTQTDVPDFMMLCASLTGLMGNPGQGDYTAANSFLDAFAHFRGFRRGKTLAIDWSGWKETGMAKDYGVNEDDIFKVLPTAAAIDAFATILQKHIRQVVVGELNIPLAAAMDTTIPLPLSTELRLRLERYKNTPTAPTAPMPAKEPVSTFQVRLKGRADQRYTPMEEGIGQVWAQLFGFQDIDIYDNYYDMGGDSINALNIINRVNQRFNTNVGVIDIFNNLTLESFAKFMEERTANAGGVQKETHARVDPVEKREHYPVSAAQKRLFTLYQFDKNSTNYNLPDILTIEGPVEAAQLEKAFRRLIQRHESLRTSFLLIDEEPVQVVHPVPPFQMPVLDVTDAQVSQQVRRFVRAFPLETAPLFRAELLRVSPAHHVLMVDVHHIVADAMACELLISEFILLYNNIEPQPLRVQYKDFASWQNRLFASDTIKGQENYWIDQFSPSIPLLELPLDFPRPPIRSFAGDTQTVVLNQVETDQLRAFARKQGTTLYMVLMSVYFTLLYRYSGQEDIVIGSSNLGRPHADLERIIGMFVNILGIRNFPQRKKSFAAFLGEVKECALKAAENQDYPFDELVERLDVKRDFSRNPLADVVFSFISFDKGATGKSGAQAGNLSFKPYQGEVKKSSKADITFFCTEEKERLIFLFEYCSALFKGETMERFARHFVNLAGQVRQNPSLRLGEIDFLPEAEKRQLLYDFNCISDSAEEITVPATTLHGLFQAQVTRTPESLAILSSGADPNNKTALPKPEAHNGSESPTPPTSPKAVHDGGPGGASPWPAGRPLGEPPEASNYQTTYTQLSHQARHLAHFLHQKGLGKGDIVALLLDQPLVIPPVILGVLEAGAVWLPIDPTYPPERIRYMLADSGARMLLTTAALEKGLDFGGDAAVPKETAIFHIEDIFAGTLQGEELPGHPVQMEPGDPAYIIYTSGTTGRPKGVMVEHRSIVNTLWARKEEYRFSSGDTMLQLFSYAFDGFLTGFFTPLICGARLVMMGSEEIKSLARIEAALKECRVTHFICVPPLYRVILREVSDEALAHLRVVTLAGDRVHPDLLELSREKKKDLEIALEYGVTEGAVLSTLYRHQERDEAVKIGRPIANTSVFVLAPFLETGKIIEIIDLGRGLYLQPLGVPGELCITGAGVARGYLNRPELTAEGFVDAKSIDQSGIASPSRLYKTGDLVRWLPDGQLEFLGRIDHQVKIRGFRIELGEIEQLLQSFQRFNEKIKAAVVVARPLGAQEGIGDNYLCAYYVASIPIDAADLRKHLGAKLPDYMIPAHFIQLETMPLTANQKIDRAALPEPAALGEVDALTGDRAARAPYAPPETPIHGKLVEIWSDILGLKKEAVGIDDNFFDLGGHSLKGTVMVSQVQKFMQREFSLADLFLAPTIRELTVIIESSDVHVHTAIPVVEIRDYYPASSAQKRFFILQQLEANSTDFNTPNLVLLEGALDVSRAQAVFQHMLERHDSLRTAFIIIDGEPVQRVHRQLDFQLEVLEGEGDSEEQLGRLVHNFLRPFDLSVAPLLHAGLVRLGEEKFLLMIDMHHIISDGVSMELFIREVTALYRGDQLPPLRIQYKDYTLWQGGDRQQAAIRQQERFWLGQFSGEIPVLSLPVDYPRPKVQGVEGTGTGFAIPTDQTKGLNALALSEGTTLFMVLIGMLTIFLNRISGQEDVVVGTPIAGRRHADLQNVIGLFINTLALRYYPAGEMTFRALLSSVKERTLAAFLNQDYPFEELVEKANVARDPSRNPLFDILFALQNMAGYGGGAAAVEKQKTDIPKQTLSVTPHEVDGNVAHFDLNFVATEGSDSIYMGMTYSTQLFKDETAGRLLRYFQNIIAAVLDNPDLKLKAIPIISEEEKQQILHDFNGPDVPFDTDRTFHDLFREQVERTPDGVALLGRSACNAAPGLITESGETDGQDVSHQSSQAAQAVQGAAGAQFSHLTYSELNRRANRLALELRALGAGPDVLVAVMADRCIEMILAVLAIFKSGGAYVPVDPGYPEERIRYMLENSGSPILLAQKRYLDTQPHWTGETLCLDEWDANKNTGDHLTDNQPSRGEPHNLAYCIYTSGSTGLPKGVLVQHNHLVNAVFGWREKYHLDRMDVRLLQMSSFSFDVFAGDLSRGLLNGGKMVIHCEAVVDPVVLYGHIVKHQITLFESTPAFVVPFMDYVYDNHLPISNLQLLILGSDSCRVEDFKRLLERFGDQMRIVNSYGVTEATIDSSFYETSPSDLPPMGNVPIGSPLPNMRFYIMDTVANLQPVGIPGELFIGGKSVARGYLNRDELTRERFSPDPFNIGERIYKTGDCARWLPDGSVDFLGRLDQQVKIRGYRIELGEIEAQLTAHPAVAEAVVAARKSDSGDRYLCAYLTPVAKDLPLADALDFSQIKEYLSQGLPPHMIPAYFVPLKLIPLTPNGKVDRKNLPEPSKEVESDIPYIAPTEDMEKQLVEIWAKVLELEPQKIGIRHHFFDHLGGHSLKAVFLMLAVQKAFEPNFSLKDVLESATIESMAHTLKQRAGLAPMTEKNYVLFNESQEPRLFCFPPQLPFGLVYRELAGHLPDLGMVCFDFVEHKKRLKEYMRLIREFQPQPPYHFFGFSSGGLLAFEVAAYMNRKGHPVSDIIMVDTISSISKEQAQSFESKGDGMQEILTGLEGLFKDNPGLRRKTIEKMQAYSHYMGQVTILKPTDSTIHLVRSESKEKLFTDNTWRPYTSGDYKEYTGSGLHTNMLNAAHIAQNAKIIQEILKAKNKRNS